MPDEIAAPFSARNRGAIPQIEGDCPPTARIGLIHLMNDLVAKNYVRGWDELLAEIQRIARLMPEKSKSPRQVAETLMQDFLAWDKVFDFCERLHNHLAEDAYEYNQETDSRELAARKDQVQEYIAKELQRLFLEEHLAFEFSGGLVRRRGRRNTAEQISRAEMVLGDPRLSAARAHYNKALHYFRAITPDLENVVKESVCAVEATARVLFPDSGNTLGEILNSIGGRELPKAIGQTFHGLYGFRGAGEGVTHGGSTGGTVTKGIAEYSLAVAASQIVLLVDIGRDDDVPF